MIKSTMGYNQRQVAILGVAKDLGDSIGFVPGSLCEIFPIWAISLIGVVQNFVGYGLVWLIVAQKVPALPLWVVSSIICFYHLICVLNMYLIYKKKIFLTFEFSYDCLYFESRVS